MTLALIGMNAWRCVGMSDNEIKKALECCSEPAGKCCCEVCPLHHREDSCTTALIKMAVELVNRQQAEIERLERNFKAAKVDAKLKKQEIERFVVKQYALKAVIKRYEKDLKKAKSEAIKEFAERLKEQIYIKKDKGLYFEKIDNLVKEMTEVSEK